MEQWKEVKRDALEGSEIHEKWEQRYRTTANDPYFKAVILDAFMAHQVVAPGARVLDAGCGTGVKSLILAQLGFQVLAIDKSHRVLSKAHARAEQAGLSDRIEFRQADLTALHLSDASIDAVLCWAALMHIDDLNAATKEIARVLKPGGAAVIVEANHNSLQSIAERMLRSIGLLSGIQNNSPFGLEIRKDSEDGQLLVRHMAIRQLIELFASYGLKISKRSAGQFTEAYAILSSKRLSSFVHKFNIFWYEKIHLAHPSFTNVLILEKSTDETKQAENLH